MEIQASEFCRFGSILLSGTFEQEITSRGCEAFAATVMDFESLGSVKGSLAAEACQNHEDG